MRIPHKVASVFVSSLLFLAILISGSQNNSPAQDLTEPTTARDIQLYEKGKAPEEIKLPKKIDEKHPDDADAWYYLGLSLYREGLIGHAGPAFEKTVELRPNFSEARAKLAFQSYLSILKFRSAGLQGQRSKPKTPCHLKTGAAVFGSGTSRRSDRHGSYPPHILFRG